MKPKPVRTVAELQARALKATLNTFYVNGVFTLMWFVWLSFNIWEAIMLTPWYWLNAAWTAGLLAWHGYQSKKSLRNYVELKERYERG